MVLYIYTMNYEACILQGDLVYVNYGRVEDYITLEQKLSLNVNGKIALARYGKIFRGDKVSGFIVLIFYSFICFKYLIKAFYFFPYIYILSCPVLLRGR